MIAKRLIAALTMLCAIAACAPVPDASPSVAPASQISFIDDPKLVRHSRIALSANAQTAFGKFRGEPNAFGAMYVLPNGRGWSWHAGIVTLEDAKQLAKIGCDTVTRGNCVLYATLEPVTPAAKGALPQRLRRQIEDAKLETNPGGYLVVAANRASDLGYSWNYNAQSEARNAALRQCEADAKDSRARRADDAVEVRVDVELEKAGFFDCRIFAIYR